MDDCECLRIPFTRAHNHDWESTGQRHERGLRIAVNPIIFTGKVVRSLLRYQLTAYPLADAPAAFAEGKWIQAIHDLWGEIWIPRMDFGLKARLQKEDRIRLDSEQISVLQGLMDNDSVLVEGAAGTGKTMLALAMAQRMAQSGKRVLMLCFTEPLACWLQKQAGTADLSIWAIKRYALDLLRQSGKKVVVQDTSQFWRRVSLEAAIEALPKLQTGWDAVVVDEGQDLIDDDWMLVEELSRNKPLWAFWDPDQAFWTDRKLREDLFKTRYRLQKKYRCPEAVQQLAYAYRGGTLDLPGLRQAIEQDVIAIRACPGAGTVPERIATEIDKLKGSGLDPADIAVLSLRGAAEPESIIYRKRLGTHSYQNTSPILKRQDSSGIPTTALNMRITRWRLNVPPISKEEPTWFPLIAICTDRCESLLTKKEFRPKHS
jgi:hypothetical protein